MKHKSGSFNTVTSPWDQLLERAIDIGISSTVLVAPLFMGGRGPVGRFVFFLCVAGTVLLWCIRQSISTKAVWRKCGVEWLLLAGFGLILLQLTHLPQAMMSILSPRIADLLPLWTSGGSSTVQLGTWNQISLNPTATHSGLATYSVYAALFLVAFQHLRSREDVERLLKLVAVATCLLAVLGLTQFLFSNGKFLWVFEHVSRDTAHAVKGPFQNQNHFAHLMALGIGPLLWWLATLSQSTPDRESRSFDRQHKVGSTTQFLWIGVGLVCFAALLTFSRGGVIAITAAAGLSVGILAWNGKLSRRAMSVVAIIVCLMVASLSIHGYEPLARRLATLDGSHSVEEFARGRIELWNAHLDAIPDFWILGTGVGTHQDIYPTYLHEYFNVNFTHGESGYFQLLLETGIAGCILFFIGVGIAIRWLLSLLVRQSKKEELVYIVAIAPGIAASLLHSLGDFVWYIPACMTTTVLLLAAACHLFHESTTESHRTTKNELSFQVPRIAWTANTAICILVFTLLGNTLLKPAFAAPHWYDFRRLERVTNARQLEPIARDDLAHLATYVEKSVAAHPSDARARIQLASLLLTQFDVEQQTSQNPMPLSQIRDAALASQFASKQDLDNWLNLAVGENRKLFDSALKHAQASVQLCPLQGEAYALLARLAFLEGPDPTRKDQYIQQALHVRPFDSRVQFVAGQEALLAGNGDKAMQHWKNAFRGEAAVRNELVRELTAVVPAADLITVLEPDSQGCDVIFNQYRYSGDVESAQVVAKHQLQILWEANKTTETQDELPLLRKQAYLLEYLSQIDDAVRVTRRAAQMAPADFALRLQLGRLLVAQEDFHAAKTELEWCARHKPDHSETRQLLSIANRQSHLHQAGSQQANTENRPIHR